jgi:hypothetical protein
VEILKDLGISANMLHRWVREQEGNPKVIGNKEETVSAQKFERMRDAVQV